MKLLAIEMSRITSLFTAARLGGQVYLPHAAAKLAERYNFMGAPHSLEDLVGNKVEFQHGLFEDNAIEALEIYNDGVIVASRSDSDFIDKFLDDLSSWIEVDLGFSIAQTHRVNKMYDSTLIVETDKNIFEPLDAYADIARMIDKKLHNSSGIEVQFQHFSWTLSADHTQNPALKPVPFRFERKAGVEFSLNQYYTTAPLKTKQHIEILREIEKLA